VPATHSEINKPTSTRYGFLDFYRGIIVLFMLEGHVYRELLDPHIKSSQIYMLHEILHGITAPGFLFGAGFAFTIAAQRKWNQVTTFSPGFFRRLWRAITLILIGYILHLPYMSLRESIELGTPAQWEQFFRFDVLQCIGTGLIILRLLLVMVRNERVFVSATVFLLILIVYSTPFAWSTELNSKLPSFISPILNGNTGSLFPLFPFVGFLFAGTCVSWLFLRATEKGKNKSFIIKLAIAGVMLICLGFILEAMPFKIIEGISFWKTSPNYFWIRLGILFIILGGLWSLEYIANIKNKRTLLMPRWLIILGIESLFVYIAHLIILYGWTINPTLNFSYFFKDKLNVIESSIVLLILTLLMIPSATVWNYTKKHHPMLMKGIQWWIGLSLIWLILIQ